MSYLFLGSTVPGICLPPGTGLHVRKKHGTLVLCMSIKCQKNMARLYQVLVSYRTLLCTSDSVPYVPCTALMRNSQTSLLATHAHVTIKQVACLFSFFFFCCWRLGISCPRASWQVDCYFCFAFCIFLFAAVAASAHVDCCFCVSFVFTQFTFNVLFFAVSHLGKLCLHLFIFLPSLILASFTPWTLPKARHATIDCCFLLLVYTGW